MVDLGGAEAGMGMGSKVADGDGYVVSVPYTVEVLLNFRSLGFVAAIETIFCYCPVMFSIWWSPLQTQ